VSLRAKLTAAYAGAILLTTGVFAAALWVGRGASVYLELQRGALAQADAALRMVREAEAKGEPIALVTDSLVGPRLSPRLGGSFDVIPDFLWVVDTTGRLLYESRAARRLTPEQSDVVLRTVPRLRRTNVSAVVAVGGSELLVAAVRPEGEPPSGIGAVVAGAPTTATVLAGRELLGTMVVVAPIILLLSIGVAYAIAASAFEPVGRIINEVEAITDGRSLHRRLPVYEGGDELGRLVATLNAMIARLEHSFGALRRFTADASHELKTPLTVLRADVERAMSASTPSAERLVALEEALQETARMSDLVNSLLTLARADEGRFDLHREPVALSGLVADVFETAVILGENAGLAVSLDADEGGVVHGDVTRLRQLMLNLVTNAIKYTPRGGRVYLTLRCEGEHAVFSVRDTGIGIAAADLPHVFERFWRADRARSRGAERAGFGLGLAISQYLAQAHGGTLTVQSRLGRGSTFTLTLPLGRALPRAEGAPGAAPESAPV
jgi:two-component system, OmpR family, sensor kinase